MILAVRKDAIQWLCFHFYLIACNIFLYPGGMCEWFYWWDIRLKKKNH